MRQVRNIYWNTNDRKKKIFEEELINNLMQSDNGQDVYATINSNRVYICKKAFDIEYTGYWKVLLKYTGNIDENIYKIITLTNHINYIGRVILNESKKPILIFNFDKGSKNK